MSVENRQEVEYNIDGEWVPNEELCSYCDYGRDDCSTQFLYQIHGELVCEDESCAYAFMQSYCDEVIDIKSPDIERRIAPANLWDLKTGDIVRFTKDKDFYFFDKIRTLTEWKNFVGVAEFNSDYFIFRLGEYTSGDKKGEKEIFSPVDYLTLMEYSYRFENEYSKLLSVYKGKKNAYLNIDKSEENRWHFELLDENRTDLL